MKGDKGKMADSTVMINTPIQMIASCSISGEFTPIRFRYETPACDLVTVNVVSVENRKHKFTNANHEMTYVCRGSIDGVGTLSFHLRYYVPHHKWTLTKVGR